MNILILTLLLSGEFGDVGSYSGTQDSMTVTNQSASLVNFTFTNGTYCEGKCIIGTLDAKIFTWQDSGYKFQLAFNPDWSFTWGGSYLMWNAGNNASLVSESYIGAVPEPDTLYLLLFGLMACFFLYASNSIWRLSNHDS